jgi:type II secretory pathway pseudopilin PulG
MRRPLLVGLIVGLLVVILGIVGALVASSIIERNDAIAEHRVVAGALAEAATASETAVSEADDVLAVATDPLLDAGAVAALSTERDAADTRLDVAGRLLNTDLESLDTEAVRDLTDDLRPLVDEVRGDDERVFGAIEGVVDLAAAAGHEVDAENFDAENQPRIAFRYALADLDRAENEVAADYLLDYLDAASALEASHAEELAEKAGPLLDRRLAVQKFARSFSGGVLLDFDWAPTVNGYGSGGSYGGTSYWFSADGGYATITLSDSVATLWPNPGVQALVIHEVGHAILARSDCNALFFESEFAAAGEEPWATAWAIGQGYTADGNGESVYGRPPEALIATSTRCR